MIIITALLAFLALKWFDVGPFVNVSWWWFAAACMAAFIWFEFIERILGLDKRAAHDKSEKMREQRVKDTFRKK